MMPPVHFCFEYPLPRHFFPPTDIFPQEYLFDIKTVGPNLSLPWGVCGMCIVSLLRRSCSSYHSGEALEADRFPSGMFGMFGAGD